MSGYPQAVIIDAMFVINTKTLRNTNTVSRYTKLLFTHFIIDYFSCGVPPEVHIIFDKNSSQFNPKQFNKQDRMLMPILMIINLLITTPTSWCQTLECRTRKYSLIKAIGLCFLQFGYNNIKP